LDGKSGARRCSGLVSAGIIADLNTPALTSLSVATLISLLEAPWAPKATSRINECSQDSSRAYMAGKLSKRRIYMEIRPFHCMPQPSGNV
jgi:hypothetical protein